MKKTTALILVLLALALYYKGYTVGTRLATTGHAKLQGLNIEEVGDTPAELWIEVHDVSPGYGLEMLGEITNIIDKHKPVVDKTVLFVIPNHNGNTPLSKYPEFAAELKRLSHEGYVLGMHGYTHRVGWINPEFKTNQTTARALVDASKTEFKLAGLNTPSYFSPPGWRTSKDASQLLRSEFKYIFYAFFIDTGNSTLPYPLHEYTWSGLDMGGLENAKKSYKNTVGIYRLTLHLNAVNTEENLELLDKFLKFVEEEKRLP
ncbi:MAG: DUF2334 domain-containing protein [Candidatus Hydrothermarchaeales archaeon]